MTFEELSPHAEQLLQEILEHRNEKGICDSNYWEGRFSGLEFAEDERLRSLFKELKENDMIITRWADNYPYIIHLTDKGLSYSENKKLHEKQAKKLSRREWKIALVSAALGAVIGQIPQIIQLLGT